MRELAAGASTSAEGGAIDVRFLEFNQRVRPLGSTRWEPGARKAMDDDAADAVPEAPASGPSTARAQEWIDAHEENKSMNQYWYSAQTVGRMVEVVRRCCLDGPTPLDCAFISTPSLFFALPRAERTNCRVLDIDMKLAASSPKEFVYYDYNSPSKIPDELRGAFSAVVIDPPFITKDVWEKYAQAAKLLLAGGAGLVMATTVVENASLLEELLGPGLKPNAFLPSIPHLPYQYALYTNFETPEFSVRNEEIAGDPEEILSPAEHVLQHPREAETPVRGAGNTYDFEKMLEEAMKTSEHIPPATGQQGR